MFTEQLLYILTREELRGRPGLGDSCVQPYEKRELEEGDEIKFGRKMLVFR